MKVKIVKPPTGLINGREWPGVGEVADLMDAVAEGLIAGGYAEAAAVKAVDRKVEKRPASTKGVEKRSK